MKRRRLFTMLLVALVFSLPILAYSYAETQEILLNHEVPVMIKGEYEYFPVIEKAYVVGPHILLTMDMRHGHFPNDGVLVGTDIPVWFYWLDYTSGVKAFLVEEVLDISDNLPEWALLLTPVVEKSLETDGGWENRITEFSGKKYIPLPLQTH